MEEGVTEQAAPTWGAMGQREALDTGEGLSVRQKGVSSLPGRGSSVTQILGGHLLLHFLIFVLNWVPTLSPASSALHAE